MRTLPGAAGTDVSDAALSLAGSTSPRCLKIIDLNKCNGCLQLAAFVYGRANEFCTGILALTSIRFRPE